MLTISITIQMANFERLELIINSLDIPLLIILFGALHHYCNVIKAFDKS